MRRAYPYFISRAWLMQVIKGRLYVGSRAQAQNWTLLQTLGITHIVNVSRDSKETFEGMLQYLSAALSLLAYLRLQRKKYVMLDFLVGTAGLTC
jgi:hypothetical protein